LLVFHTFVKEDCRGSARLHFIKKKGTLPFVETKKKKQRLKKFRKKVDKLLLGAVVGGAVGSILGVTLAPKSGRETRKLIGEKGKEAWKRVAEKAEKKSEQNESKKTEPEKKGFWFTLNRLLIKKKK
jgi:hypothetical protein